MFAFLKRPYPSPESVDNGEVVSRAVIAGTIVAGILVFYQPFGLDKIDVQNRTLILAGYGIITALAILFIHFAIFKNLPSLFREKNWNVYKELLAQLFTLAVIGTFNGVYNTLSSGQAYNFNSVFGMMLNTALIGIFPIGVFTLIDHYRLSSKYEKLSSSIDSNLQSQNAGTAKTISIHPILDSKPSVILRGTQENEELEVQVENLLYIAAQANYVTINYRKGEKVERSVFRTTLTSIQAQLKGRKSLMRCHRSFLVNLDQVERSEGNAQGLKLSMKNCEEKVSVSRKYVPLVRSWFS